MPSVRSKITQYNYESREQMTNMYPSAEENITVFVLQALKACGPPVTGTGVADICDTAIARKAWGKVTYDSCPGACGKPLPSIRDHESTQTTSRCLEETQFFVELL